LYVFHIQRVQRLSYVDRADVHGIADISNVIRAVPRSVMALLAWAYEVALPSAYVYAPSLFNRLSKVFVFSWHSPIDLLNVALLAAALVLLGMSLSRPHLRRRGPLVALLFGSLFAYAAVLCLGRPPDEV